MKFSDLKVGDRVHHLLLNDYGVVEKVEGGIIDVRFDKPHSRGDTLGMFDRTWFDLHGDILKKVPSREEERLAGELKD